MNEKFLIFVDGADDAAMFPASRLQSITCASDGVVLVKFSPGSLGEGGTITADGGTAGGIDIITLTVTANTELTVLNSKLNFNYKNIIVQKIIIY